jgi:hypothetical protein
VPKGWSRDKLNFHFCKKKIERVKKAVNIKIQRRKEKGTV